MFASQCQIIKAEKEQSIILIHIYCITCVVKREIDQNWKSENSVLVLEINSSLD